MGIVIAFQVGLRIKSGEGRSRFILFFPRRFETLINCITLPNTFCSRVL